jgi:hypothetical protein
MKSRRLALPIITMTLRAATFSLCQFTENFKEEGFLTTLHY